MPDALQPAVSIVTDYVPFIPAGKERLDIAFTVTSSGFATSGYSRKHWNGIVIDVSGSMQGERIIRAKEAAQVAIDETGEHDYICVVIFDVSAKIVFPSALATAQNKYNAKKAVERISANGNTFFATGLSAAFAEFERCPDCDGTVVFLSDGDNHDPGGLANVLSFLTDKRTHGVTFKVQCRCVGTDVSSMADLHAIAKATLGDSPVAIADPLRLATDFRAIFQTAQTNTLSNVDLVVYSPRVVTIGSIKQISPTINDMTAEIQDEPGTQNHVVSTGAWGNESRTFYVSFNVPANVSGKQITCGRIMIRYHYGGQTHTVPPEGEVIKANWTDLNDPRSQRVSPSVALAKGTVEAVPLLDEAVAAYRAGQRDVATQKLGRVAQIASETGDGDLLQLVTHMATIDNAAAGAVTLKAVNKATTMEVEGASTKRAITVRAVRPAPEQ